MKTIFVVDDDPDDLDIFSQAVREIDASIICIECADSMIAGHLLKTMILPDIAVLDINMPLCNGYELLKDIRSDSRLNDLPVVMLSTTMDDRSRNQLQDMGAQYMLTKPATFGEYVEMVRSIVKGQRSSSC
ncbi:response regulator [Chryseolinea sp. T2]|uniref:response regulator n=1 Tax=Chryseolinea sp. T2 TaxID=3129255 RepID=UPI003077F1B0